MDESTSLHGFADIVGYSRLNAYQQAESQERLVMAIEASLVDAGVRPDSMGVQDQGDACLLTFPDHLDVSRVLAVMPRRFNDELNAFNQDRTPPARMRVRLSFVMGPSARGRTGRPGRAPIAVTRMNNAPALRTAMTARPDVYLGVVIDDYLYHQYVMQQFRPDLAKDEYTPARVSFPEKDFDAEAWIRLVGYRADAWLADVGSAELTVPRPSPKPFGFPADAVFRHQPRVRDDGAVRERAPYNDGGTGHSGGDQAVQSGDGRTRGRHIPIAVTTIIVVAIAGGVGLLVAYSSDSTGSDGSRGYSPSSKASLSQPTLSTVTDTPSASSTAPATGAVEATVTEYGDWRPGVQVYANNQAATSNAPVIPLNQPIHVACVAPNDSGIPSINAFYRIVSGPWNGTYASCNEFTNGGPLDSASDPAIDPRVPHCAVG